MFDVLFNTVLPFLIILTILVFVHELGHYWVAIKNGVKVETFSIGFGYELFGFNDEIYQKYNQIDFAITRSGASTISELIFFNIPILAIPLPKSKDDHQFKNADVFRKKEAAWIFSEKDLDEGRFFKFLIKTLDNYKILNKKAIKNRSLASPNATKDISNLIMRL